jgi:adenine C2-methylase RlmN of 23S rRNA A2503 and tRNA A37
MCSNLGKNKVREKKMVSIIVMMKIGDIFQNFDVWQGSFRTLAFGAKIVARKILSHTTELARLFYFKRY